MLARYDAQNTQALEKLLKTGIQVHAYSQEILEAAEKASFENMMNLQLKTLILKQFMNSGNPLETGCMLGTI